MKSKFVFLIAMLLLCGIVLASVSFALRAAEEYDNIVISQKKPNSSAGDQKEDDELSGNGGNEGGESGEGGNEGEGESGEGIGGMPEYPVPPPVVTPQLDEYFSVAKEGAHTGGYRWVKTDQYEAWQPITGDGSNATTTLFRYGGDGYWLIEDTNPGWVSDPVVTFSYDGSPRMEFANVHFYYQVCRNGIWEDELHPMDGSLFSAYICKVNLYSELNDFSIHKVVKVESGYYQFVLDGRYKAYVCVGLESAWDPTITAVNFYMEYFY